MIERVTPEPSQDELAAIRAALSRRIHSSSPARATWTVDARELEFDELRAAARSRRQRPS